MEALVFIKSLAFEGKSAEEITKILDDKKIWFQEGDLEIAKSRIDEFVIKYQMVAQAKSNAVQKMIMGAFLLAMGLGVSLYTWWGSRSIFVFLYGLILGGIYLVWQGYGVYKTPVEEFEMKKGFMKRRI